MSDDGMPLPPGDEIHWDGQGLRRGGVVLEPGRYAIPGAAGAVLEVAPAGPDVPGDIADSGIGEIAMNPK